MLPSGSGAGGMGEEDAGPQEVWRDEGGEEGRAPRVSRHPWCVIQVLRTGACLCSQGLAAGRRAVR